MSCPFDPETFSKQFKKHYDYIIKEDEEMWDNIYPMSDWTLDDHNLLWKFVDRKMLVFDISIGGFVLTDWYIEQEKEEWVYDPNGKFKIKKEDKCFCDDCYNYGVVEWKAMECFVCRDCAKTIKRNVKKFTKQWEK